MEKVRKIFIFISIILTIIFAFVIIALKNQNCNYDEDCACGINKITKECAYGNKFFIDESIQCPDFCNGIAGNMVVKCINKTCKQVVISK